jgi:hypothetical protein
MYCAFENCKKKPGYNTKGLKVSKFCVNHKEADMIHIKTDFCKEKDCLVRASFNYEKEKKVLYCNSHKKAGMINIRDNKCKVDGCTTTAIFGLEGNKKEYCSRHKSENMVSHIKKCEQSNCDITPSFNFKGEKVAKFCSKHKLDNMVDVKYKKCEFENCTKTPNFNMKGLSAIFCKTHKQEGMVNVKNRTCEHDDCDKRPSYNLKGEKVGRFCKEHRLQDMIDVANQICEYENCTIRPQYTYEGETKARFCTEHRLENMVNVRNIYCEKKDCKTVATFNVKGKTKPRFCAKHKEIGMVSLDKKCAGEDCTFKCSFGFIGQETLYCSRHKSENMFRYPNRKCTECDELATYGKKNQVHCEEHSKPDEHCLLVKKCNRCNRENMLLDKDDLCLLFCKAIDIHQQKKSENRKETVVHRYLDEHIKIKPTLIDKKIDDGCSGKRPDRLYDVGTHIVVVEVDEFQHSGYDKKCDIARMDQIQQDYGLPSIFLRYNPDAFNVKGKPCKKYNESKRLSILVKWLETAFTMKPKSEMEPVLYKKLFFNDYSESDMSFMVIDQLLYV